MAGHHSSRGGIRAIVGAQGVKYAVDPVVGETGTQIYQLFEDIVAFMREGVLGTVSARAFSLDEISAAVTQAESMGR